MSQGEGYWANAWLCYARRTNPGQQDQLTLKLIHTLAWATAQIGGSWPVTDSKLCSTTGLENRACVQQARTTHPFHGFMPSLALPL